MTDQSLHYSEPTRNVRRRTGDAATVTLNGDRWLDRGDRRTTSGLRAPRHGGLIEPEIEPARLTRS